MAAGMAIEHHEVDERMQLVVLKGSARHQPTSGRVRPFPTLWSVRPEPEGSIKGSIPTARWRSCKFPSTKKRRFAALLQSPLPDSNRRPPPYHGTTGTAARTAVSPGHAQPSVAKLCAVMARTERLCSKSWYALATTDLAISPTACW
jgi:hypothetical protein